MGMVIERRHVMGGQNLPYTAEIEYIGSDCTNSQYIDTGVQLTGPYEASLTFSIPTAQSQSYGRLMGVGNDNSTPYHYCTVEIQDSKLSAYTISNSDTSGRTISVTANTATTKQVLVLNNTSSTSNTVTFNGTSKTSGCTIDYSKTSVGSVYLFCIHRTLNSGGTAIDDSAVRFTSYKLYACSFKIGGELVRDFIPVLDNHGIACLYDKVSKKCFYNQGSGDFTAGPIISALKYKKIEYIESTGTQYIDTGIKLYDTSPQNYQIDISMIGYSGSTYSCYVNSMYEASPYPGAVLRYENSQVSWGGSGISTTNKGAINTNLTLSLVINGSYSTHNINTTLFAGYDGNGNPWRYSKMRLYYCKITKNGVVVRDLIPIRVFDIGCLYDKVSKKAFGNVGTGAFTLGPDV